MTMMYGSPQAPYGMPYGVQANAIGYGQQVTVPQALGMVPNVLQAMCNAGQCTLQEAQQIQQALQNPHSQTNFSNSLLHTFGNSQVHPQQIQQWVYNKLWNAVMSLRRDMSRVNVAPGGFQGGMPQQGYGVPVYNGQAQQPTGAQNLAEIYGGNLQASEGYQATPPGSLGEQKIPRQAPEASNVKAPERVPTGKVWDIDLSDNREVWPAAKYTKCRPPEWVIKCFYQNPLQEIEEPSQGENMLAPIDNKIMSLSEYGKVDCSTVSVESCEIRAKLPQNNVGGAVNEIVASAPDLADDKRKFAHVISATELVVADAPYDETTKLLDQCRDAYLEPDPVTGKKSLRGAEKVLKVVGQGDSASVISLSTILLRSFNNAAGVNFIRKAPQFGCVQRLEQFTNLARFSRLLSDSGDFKNWVEGTDPTDFPMTLRNCIQASFGCLFRESEKAYLDLNDPVNIRTLLSSGKVNIVVSDTPGRLINYETSNDETKKEILEKLKRYTPMLFEHKILFHNLHLTSDLNEVVGRAYQIAGTAEAQILYQFFNKYGVLELISNKEPFSFTHPLIMGVSYDNQLLVRRI